MLLEQGWVIQPGFERAGVVLIVPRDDFVFGADVAVHHQLKALGGSDAREGWHGVGMGLAWG